ncbi:MAG: hypothetical protein U1F57_11165 [bacterium]
MAVKKTDHTTHTHSTDSTHHDPSHKKTGHSTHGSSSGATITKKDVDALRNHIKDMEGKHQELRAKDSDLQDMLNNLLEDVKSHDESHAEQDYDAILQAMGEKPKYSSDTPPSQQTPGNSSSHSGHSKHHHKKSKH